jgi:hypothetical protein
MVKGLHLAELVVVSKGNAGADWPGTRIRNETKLSSFSSILWCFVKKSKVDIAAK